MLRSIQFTVMMISTRIRLRAPLKTHYQEPISLREVLIRSILIPLESQVGFMEPDVLKILDENDYKKIISYGNRKRHTSKKH